jgi:hypothetical protein
MSESAPESFPSQTDDRRAAATTGAGQARGAYDSDRQVAMAAIISVTIVCLCCILSCTVVMYAFLSNPPW